MRNLFTPGKAIPCCGALVLALLAALVFAEGRRATAREAPADERPEGVFNGAAECKKCHTQPTTAEDRASLPFVMLTEFAVWKTLDKHAQAFAVLKTERSQRMGKHLGIKVEKDEACLNCHAMSALKKTATEEFDPEDGVNCAGCHGSSKGWYEAHTKQSWRKLTPEEKAKKGLVDVRDPETRARLCISCHVGNAAEGKVVTHAMFAAGHPPLPPFEVATFSLHMPPHWREPKNVPFFHMLRDVAALPEAEKDKWTDEVRAVLAKYQPGTIDKRQAQAFARLYPNPAEARKVLGQYPYAGAATFQTRLALTGNVTALRETMQLVVDRAGMGSGKNPKWLWPELGGKAPGPDFVEEQWPDIALAHSDCYACHHDLRSDSYRQKRGYGYRLPGGGMVHLKPGRVPIRNWPLSVLDLDLLVTTTDEAGFRGAVAPLARDLGLVARACDVRPFGDPARIGKAAKDLSAWCATVNKELKAAALDRVRVHRLLRSLCAMDTLVYADYESARQTAAVFAVAYAEVGPPASANAEAIQTILKDFDRDLNLKPYKDLEERQDLMEKMIQDAWRKYREETDGEKPSAASVRRFEASFQQFRKTVQDRNDMKLLVQLSKNPFLVAIRSDITNARMNEIVQKGAMELEKKAGEQALDSALKKIAAYNPVDFQRRMKALGDALAGKAPPETPAASR